LNKQKKSTLKSQKTYAMVTLSLRQRWDCWLLSKH